MGLFGSLFRKKKFASAAHILVKGNSAKELLNKLKVDISKSKNIKAAFNEAAIKHSSCPSAKNGGELGKFKEGQMVPAFDEIVFKKELGVVHGPIATPFGYHLIYINEREE